MFVQMGRSTEQSPLCFPPFTSDFSLFCESARRRHVVRSVPPKEKQTNDMMRLILIKLDQSIYTWIKDQADIQLEV